MLVLMLTLFLDDTALVKSKALASMYLPWDISSKYVPYGRYPYAWNNKPTRNDLVCAHRTLPFGTVLKLTYKDKTSICAIEDRGPFGACVPTVSDKKGKRCPLGYKWKVVKKNMPKGGYYRAVLLLLGA